MNVGILVLFVNSFGKRGAYNSQEIGMAKAFADLGHQVTVYKCVDRKEEPVDETIYPNVRYICHPVKRIGDNTVSDFNWLDTDLNLLVCFSDIQICVKSANRWAMRNHIAFVPYIGIIESSSKHPLIRHIRNWQTQNVIRFYKKVPVYVKTNAVKERLLQAGAQNVTLAPVGLDLDQMRRDYETVSSAEARKLLHLDPDAKYLLMVGRLTKGRNPLDCVETFAAVRQKSPDYRLLIVGKGELKEKLFAELAARGLAESVDYIEKIPNEEMWKAYRAADKFVSFSKWEIFGMSILEAMYYELPVYVIHAPGPNDIIEDGVSGFLFDTPQEMAEAILEEKDCRKIGKQAHERIMGFFLWRRTAKILESACGRPDPRGSDG